MYADHVRFHSCRPSLHRASTDALMMIENCIYIQTLKACLEKVYSRTDIVNTSVIVKFKASSMISKFFHSLGTAS